MEYTNFELSKIAPTQLNRPLTTDEFEEILDVCAESWLNIDDSFSEPRHSEHTYKVFPESSEDGYTIVLTRDGLLLSDNRIIFAEGTPRNLKWDICTQIFTTIAGEKLGTDSELTPSELGTVKVYTPTGLLYQELSPEEQEQYDEEYEDILLTVVSTVSSFTEPAFDDLVAAVEEYHESKQELDSRLLLSD